MKVAVITAHHQNAPWIPGMEKQLPIGQLIIGEVDPVDYAPNWGRPDFKINAAAPMMPYWVPPSNYEILGDL